MHLNVHFPLVFILLLLSWTGVHAQNIGIGTPTPDYTLDINGDLGINDFVYHNDDDGARFGFPNNDQWELELSSQKMLLADGADALLEVNPDGQNVSFAVKGQTNGEVILMTDPANNYLGIGTSNPAYLLDIDGPVRIVGDGIDHLFYANPQSDQIGIGTSNPEYLLDIAGGDVRVSGDSYQHLFYINAQDDYIGIGTSNPEYLLDVNGSVRIVGDGIDHLIFVDSENDRIGIGTDSPTGDALVEIDGLLKVNDLEVNDTPISFFESFQSGKESLITDSISGEAVEESVVFSSPFGSIPKVIVTVEVQSNPTCCTFGVSIRQLTNNGFIARVDRLGEETDQPWSNNLQIHWMAWE